MLSAFVMISAEPDAITDLASTLADLPGVAEVYSVAGDVDIVAVLRVKHHDDLADVVTGGINHLPGIRETRTMVAFRAYSRHDLESMWDLGVD